MSEQGSAHESASSGTDNAALGESILLDSAREADQWILGGSTVLS